MSVNGYQEVLLRCDINIKLGDLMKYLNSNYTQSLIDKVIIWWKKKLIEVSYIKLKKRVINIQLEM